MKYFGQTVYNEPPLVLSEPTYMRDGINNVMYEMFVTIFGLILPTIEGALVSQTTKSPRVSTDCLRCLLDR